MNTLVAELIVPHSGVAQDAAQDVCVGRSATPAANKQAWKQLISPSELGPPEAQLSGGVWVHAPNSLQHFCSTQI